MSWDNVDLAGINPTMVPIAEGEYVLQLLPGAKMADRDPNIIEAQAAIVSEGEFTGRRLFFSYPDPAKYDWSPKALKRLESALGVDASHGENPVAYLNRAAGNRFGGTVKHRSYTPDGSATPVVKAELQIFSVKAAV